ncbi:Hsp20/alpha crystallin family protein [Sulfurospirillum sp. 1307]|jgi:HSP20 family protein
MKSYKNILYAIVALLVLIVGLQGYYIYKLNEKSEPVIAQHVIDSSKLPLDKFQGANPFEDMIKMQKEMDKLFNSMSSNFATIPEFEKFFKDMSISPALDLKDLGDKYELNLNIPGSDENSINIDVKDNQLKVEAKTSKDNSKKSDNYIYKEIFSGSFSRVLTLPNDADASKLKSDYKDGVLKITIPKKD